MDESNDISTAKNLMLYVQFVDTSIRRKQLKFLKNLPLKECDATSITTAIISFFHSINISLEKAIMFTSDGAPVML